MCSSICYDSSFRLENALFLKFTENVSYLGRIYEYTKPLSVEAMKINVDSKQATLHCKAHNRIMLVSRIDLLFTLQCKQRHYSQFTELIWWLEFNACAIRDEGKRFSNANVCELRREVTLLYVVSRISKSTQFRTYNGFASITSNLLTSRPH